MIAVPKSIADRLKIRTRKVVKIVGTGWSYTGKRIEWVLCFRKCYPRASHGAYKSVDDEHMVPFCCCRAMTYRSRYTLRTRARPSVRRAEPIAEGRDFCEKKKKKLKISFVLTPRNATRASADRVKRSSGVYGAYAYYIVPAKRFIIDRALYMYCTYCAYTLKNNA
jgi:hypothetical protein